MNISELRVVGEIDESTHNYEFGDEVAKYEDVMAE